MVKENNNSRFSAMPQLVNVQRSKFGRNSGHKTTFSAGKLIPIYVDEALPGDTWEIDVSQVTRMTTPIFPVMDNCNLDYFFFFVPMRLVWDHAKEFFGENRNGYWTPSTEYTIPQVTFPGSPGVTGWTKGDIADYMGLPTLVAGGSVSALPFRALVTIWNEWFRDQNTMDPAYCPTDDAMVNGSRGTGTDTGYVTTAYLGGDLLPVCKYHDQFTSALPNAQKGPSINIPVLNGLLPVVTTADDHALLTNEALHMRQVAGTAVNVPVNLVIAPGGDSPVFSGADASNDIDTDVRFAPSNAYADASANVNLATIDELRKAVALQKILEVDALGGTRYSEVLRSHFGIVGADSRLQRPEYLGGSSIPINVDQVLQTSESSSTPQGNAAAYSLTSSVKPVCTYSCTEHGYIIGVACVRQIHSYQQGLERLWSRTRRYDFYWPELAHIGNQPILRKELMYTGSSTDDDPFGFQEAWFEYRYKKSHVTSSFRSNVTGTLDSWHYADYYTSQPILSAGFIRETAANIDRTLSVPSTVEDQFISDWYFKCTVTRVMPMYSIPGLMDHM